MHHAEAYASAFSRLLCRKVRFEGTFQYLSTHAVTAIRYRDPNVISRLKPCDLTKLCRSHILRSYGDRSAGGHGVTGVEDQVQDRQLELGRIRRCMPQPPLAASPNGYGAP